jgi:MraZ protein
MLYTGTYELTIDAKNRLSIPANIRSAMDPVRDGSKFYLVPGDRHGTLSLFADKYYEWYSEQYHASLSVLAEEKQEFEDLYYALATLLDVDKQGRVVLAQRLLDLAGLSGQVTLTGARDHLVLWNRSDHDAFVRERQQNYPELLRRARQQTLQSRPEMQNRA